jgi:hypothetical protein
VCVCACFVLFCFLYWGLNSGPTSWATPPAHFCDQFFLDRVSWTIRLGWLQTMILLIFASWIARISGVSHQHLLVFLSGPIYSFSECSHFTVKTNINDGSMQGQDPNKCTCRYLVTLGFKLVLKQLKTVCFSESMTTRTLSKTQLWKLVTQAHHWSENM